MGLATQSEGGRDEEALDTQRKRRWKT